MAWSKSQEVLAMRLRIGKAEVEVCTFECTQFLRFSFGVMNVSAVIGSMSSLSRRSFCPVTPIISFNWVTSYELLYNLCNHRIIYQKVLSGCVQS